MAASRSSAAPCDVAVVGGGLAGLTVGFRLARRGKDVLVLDASEAPGGNLQTRVLDEPEGRWLLDLGPNSFGVLAKDLVDLAHDAGLREQLLPAAASADRRWLFRDGALREVPASPPRFLLSPILPLRGRLRLLREPFIRPLPSDAPEETLAEFCDRRLGRAAREKLLTPVVSGIYAGDPERLGAESAFPRMVELERRHGSLIRAAMKGSGPPKRGHLHNFRGGMAVLPRAIAGLLGDSYRASHPVLRLERASENWRLYVAGGEPVLARQVVVAAPAPAAADILEIASPPAAEALRAIRYAPMVTVHVLAERTGWDVPDGFGFLVPRGEGLRILGCILASRLFAGRAPADHELLTIFTGGSLDEAAIALPDAAIEEYVLADLRRALGLPGALRTVITRWPRAIPQYEVGHGERVERIASALRSQPNLHAVGNWRGGIAMPDCMRTATEVATHVASALDV